MLTITINECYIVRHALNTKQINFPFNWFL